MSIEVKDVQKLAKLSHLEFSDAAAEELKNELGNILEFISKLQEVDTDKVTPFTNPSIQHVPEGRERADEVTEENNREALQEVAPAKDMGFFVVPRVIE